MTIKSPGVTATKPVPLLKKNISLDVQKLFSGLTKGMAHLATGSTAHLIGDAADIMASLGIEAAEGDSAYILVERSLLAAGLRLAQESLSHFENLSSVNEPKLSSSLKAKLTKAKIILDRKFLTDPRSLPLLSDIVPLYEQWLVDMGVAPHSAALIARRYESYFVYALSSEWRRNHSLYQQLIDAVNSPFGAAEERERDWENYFAALGLKTYENIFDEPFSLSQIYIELNAYYNIVPAKESLQSQPFEQAKKRRVVSLESELTIWLQKRNKDDAIRVVSGGPGSGKSSFMKMFCARVSENRLAKPIYIPLHLIDPSRDIVDEVARFVRDEGYLRFDPLDADVNSRNLVLVFDGLDELASQGKVAAQVAKDFVQAVERMVDRRNMNNCNIAVLISGRELIVQENETEFRKAKQVLNVLPYFVPAMEHNDYDDPSDFLKDDLRDKWWQNYGKLTDGNFMGMPDSLRKHEIDEITAQPLLNYLVALSFTRGRLDFERSLNLNHVYADLVTAVYERGYENNRIHRAISHIKQQDFVRILEEIGLAAWHGSDGRSTSVNEIVAHCKESGLENLIATFQEGAKAGVTKLLAAFFFRQHGQQASGDATFVFTHKSFGEYLTAMRIVRGMERIVVQLGRRIDNPDDGYDTNQGLVQWAKLVGPAPMSSYIHRFLKREIQQRPIEEITIWKKFFTLLLSQAIDLGLPMEKVASFSFNEASRQNNNACESLVVAVNACAELLKDSITLDFSTVNSFGTFLRKIVPQRVGPASTILFDALSYFDFSKQCFDMADLYGANLQHTKWTEARLHYANLSNARLQRSDFTKAVMVEVDLSSASFEGAELRDARLLSAKLDQTQFTGASLIGANISGSNVHDASFDEATVTNMIAKNVDFSVARQRPKGLTKEQSSFSRDKKLPRRPPTARDGELDRDNN